ncbi:MAG: hypothetical protein ACXAEF_15060, partial [Candidatus Thorarchaeota archaeon]
MKNRRSSVLAVAVSLSIILSLFGMFTLAAATDGTIYVADPTGIPETDWNNIQTALDNAMPGDTIVLAAGDYYIHRAFVKESFSGA